jgi:hypothetical protein
MDRMSHSSTRAALVYLHGSDVRQRAIADRVSRLAQSELDQQANRQPSEKRSGTRRARKRRRAS